MGERKTFFSTVLLVGVIIGVAAGSVALADSTSKTGLIAFTRGEGSGQEIVIYNPTTSSERQLTYNNVWDGLPVWSPSGRWLAFVRAIPDRGTLTKHDFVLNERDEILVADQDSGNLICIGKSAHTEPYELGGCAEYWPEIPPLAGVTNLCWTQDETGILFEAPCSVTNDLILRMDVPSGELHLLCLGNDLRSLGQGRFIVWRHEYDEYGGYNRSYVIDPWGNVLSTPPHADQQK